jgi:bacterioferritin (cytochrome b1)
MHEIRGRLCPMLTSQKVIDAINEQVGYEFSASLQYYAIGAHFAAEALPQLSQHFFQQAEEETGWSGWPESRTITSRLIFSNGS